MRVLLIAAAGILALALSACGESSQLPEQASTGPDPQIPAPQTSLIPTVNIADATGWSGAGSTDDPASRTTSCGA